MKKLKREESEAANKIKKLDFSRLSAAHKDKLRRQLLGGTSRPLIDNDELDDDALGAVAGGIEIELEENKEENQ